MWFSRRSRRLSKDIAGLELMTSSKGRGTRIAVLTISNKTVPNKHADWGFDLQQTTQTRQYPIGCPSVTSILLFCADFNRVPRRGTRVRSEIRNNDFNSFMLFRIPIRDIRTHSFYYYTYNYNNLTTCIQINMVRVADSVINYVLIVVKYSTDFVPLAQIVKFVLTLDVILFPRHSSGIGFVNV